MTTVVVASFFEEENVRRIEEMEGARLLYRSDLVPPPRWPGDIVGERSWERTPEQQEEFLAMLSEAEVLLDFPRGIEAPLVEAAPELRWVQGGMAGAGPVAQDAGLLDTNVLVTTASGVFSGQLAEFVVGGMLHHAKDFDRLRREKERKEWHEGQTGTLEGKTLCIVGIGSIGRAIAKRARPFGMRLLGVKRTASGDPARHGVDELYPVEELHEALGRAEYVTLTLPRTGATERLIDAEAFAAMKAGAHLSNVGRGAVVDEEALVEALGSGHLSGAALDVFAEEPLPEESPLWEIEGVIISPHSTDNVPVLAERKLVDLFVENLGRYMAGEKLVNVLDKEQLY